MWGHRSNKKKTQAPQTVYQLRLLMVIAFLIGLGLILIIRLADLAVINRKFLCKQGYTRSVRYIQLPAHRGMILDRRGEPLAVSTPVDAVWIDPTFFNPTAFQLRKLSQLVHLSKQKLLRKVLLGRDKEFIYLKRGLNPLLAQRLQSLKIPGLYLQHEYHRYYPEGPVTAQVIGLTNVDDIGQEGLELAYNHWLEGKAGLKQVMKDRLGHVVSEMRLIRQPKPGHNLQLSIDKRLQYLAFKELASGVRNYQATSGTIVILDVESGEILAMVNWPSYNPNDRLSARKGHTRNCAVTDVFEPGSTMKTFSMASVLASRRYKATDKVDTSPGWMIVSGKRIMDERNNKVMDLTKILQISSNIGISKLILSLPPENLRNMLFSMGFGQTTQSQFPGEQRGYLPNFTVWNPFVLATLSFGYGISVTALQLAQAYAILANNGVKVPVQFLKAQNVEGKRVLDKAISQEIMRMLETVLTRKGTAPLARVPGYRVIGKTGTARMVGAHGYEKHRHNSIFIGIAPASRPRLVVAVILYDLKGRSYYGGYTAGPIFSHVMNDALRLLNVSPDDWAGFKQSI